MVPWAETVAHHLGETDHRRGEMAHHLHGTARLAMTENQVVMIEIHQDEEVAHHRITGESEILREEMTEMGHPVHVVMMIAAIEVGEIVADPAEEIPIVIRVEETTPDVMTEGKRYFGLKKTKFENMYVGKCVYTLSGSIFA